MTADTVKIDALITDDHRSVVICDNGLLAQDLAIICDIVFQQAQTEEAIDEEP